MRRQRLNYARILGIGLAISLAAHVAVLGLARWSGGTSEPTDGPLNVVTLPEPESRLEEREAVLAADGELPSAGGFRISEVEVASAGMELAEYRIVLAGASAAELTEPLVPRPRVTTASIETGLSPIRVREPALLTLRDRDRQGGGGGIGISIFLGVGGHHGNSCVPSAINIRYPNRALPVARLPNRVVPANFNVAARRNQVRMPVQRLGRR
ncbi:MAG: hypothetical protein V3U13_09825 [Gemmatimonadota bacterium]|jgi:hypothetical protein